MLNYHSTLKHNDHGNEFKSERDRKRATTKVELRPLTNRNANESFIIAPPPPPSSRPFSSQPNNDQNNTNIIINSFKKIRDFNKKKSVIIPLSFFIILTTFLNHQNLSNYDSALHNIKEEQLLENTNIYIPEQQTELQRRNRFDYIFEALKKYTNVENLRNKESPQYAALDWIANNDAYNIKPQHPRFVQRYVLALLYFSTNGPTEWKSSKKFLTPLDECTWEDNGGVRNCTDEGFVTDLSLWNNLHGTIPSEIGYLTSLKTLYLSRNKLTGTLPTELGNLNQLSYLGLQHNQLKGTVPEEYYGNLKELKYLMLEKNDLSGTIRKIGPLCTLMEVGKLQMFTSDCRTLIQSQEPEITCSCCTKCYLP